MVLELHIETEHWPFRTPFHISGHTFTHADVVVVTLTRKGVKGAGEAASVFFRGETVQSMAQQLEEARAVIERGVTRDELREILPPGGARNAVDCALWDLESKEQARPAWSIAGLSAPKPLATTITLGADSPEAMANGACLLADAPRLKVKLIGDGDDAARVRAVRRARPDAWIGVDANQGFTRASLEAIYPRLVDARVSLIEQPVRIGDEESLKGFRSEIPLAADESAHCADDVARLNGLFDVINIKLDKSGGLTEGLLMAREARRLGLKPMVGCMATTSLAMAPALLVGQLCEIVDLDAPLHLARDREPQVIYRNGTVAYGETGWGNPDITLSRRTATA
jgi:L-alanine-DL-glutamate epimerase-like enolase superfamily enzyme